MARISHQHRGAYIKAAAWRENSIKQAKIIWQRRRINRSISSIKIGVMSYQ